MKTFLIVLLLTSPMLLPACTSKDKADYDNTIPAEEDRNTEENTNDGLSQGRPGAIDRTTVDPKEQSQDSVENQ